MNILFVHQNFPGQYKHLAPFYAANPRNRVASISERHPGRVPNFPHIRHLLYETPKGSSPSTHQYLRGTEAAVRRGQAVVRVALDLRRDGFVPDVICAHPGWGEALYLKDVFPEARLLNFYEFYYHANGSDVGFDPESQPSLDDILRTRTRNATHLLSLASADWGLSPTVWQQSQFPPAFRAMISVIHDGIDTHAVRPDPNVVLKLEKQGLELSRKDEVITFVSRNLEPYRGFHIFMRALPEILRRRLKAHVLIVGGDEVSYGKAPGEGKNWRQVMMEEVGAELDMNRVHFLGKLPYPTFLKMLQVSSAHVYLTYPFVLSWSMLEAMSSGCLVIGSRTPPVEEVIVDGENGLLVDFFSPRQVAERIDEALNNPDRMEEVRQRARRTAVERYDLKSVCLPQHLALIETLAAGR